MNTTNDTAFQRSFRESRVRAEYFRERIASQIRFARFLCARQPENGAEWTKLIHAAERTVSDAAGGGPDALAVAVQQAESTLQPMSAAAKSYTVYCVGHAHIDMNWMWSWPETVGVTIDSLTTVLKLMEEFPQFVFSQSQASVYRIVEEHRPDLLGRIAERVREGRWEVTASHWVEGDKNIASAESLCRHLLYTRAYMQELFGLSPEDVQIDWSPDTFGHAHTVPTYLSRGGVKYYYHHRPGVHGDEPRRSAFWWQGPDGARILARNDMALGYNGKIAPDMVWRSLIPFVEETGLPFTMFVYGVGDHGGGPTRRDLRRAEDLSAWPVFPTLELTTAQKYFERLEREGADLPVLDCELNFEFSGCYTTQTLIKKANRYGEKLLQDAEVGAVLAKRLGGPEYPGSRLLTAWRDTLFNHFHDILPGSGVHDTRTYTHGLYQRTTATTGAIESGALRYIASKVDTSPAAQADFGKPPTAVSTSLGAGAGRGTHDGGFSAYEYRGEGDHRSIVLFNTLPYDRNEIVEATVWDPGSWGEAPPAHPAFEVTAPDGEVCRAQVVDKGHYWGHAYVTIAFPASVPSMGYAAYVVSELAPEEVTGETGEDLKAPGTATQIGYSHPCHYARYERSPEGVENDLIRVVLDPNSGGIAELVNKSTGERMVDSKDGAPSLLRYAVERARPMSAWEIEHTGREEEPVVSRIKRALDGPYKATIDVSMRIHQSELVLTYEVRQGDPVLYLHLTGTWFERGGKDIGTPTLRLAVPCAMQSQTPCYEIPFGSTERTMLHGEEVPALRWAGVRGTIGGTERGLLLLNESKHGHAHVSDTLYLTLIRSSYEPDALPEIGEHEIHMGIRPLASGPAVADATKHARAFEHALRVVSTDAHAGDLPRSTSLISWTSDRAVLNAVKESEDGTGIVVRAYNPTDEPAQGTLSFSDRVLPKVSDVREIDLLERPTGKSIEAEDGAVTAVIPPHGIWSALIAHSGA